jgi:hypothetical protein
VTPVLTADTAHCPAGFVRSAFRHCEASVALRITELLGSFGRGERIEDGHPVASLAFLSLALVFGFVHSLSGTASMMLTVEVVAIIRADHTCRGGAQHRPPALTSMASSMGGAGLNFIGPPIFSNY